MRASIARCFTALLAGSCAVALAGCGDQRRDAGVRDARDIRAVVTRAWITTDPAVRCAGAFTLKLVARMHGSQARCRKSLAAGTAGRLNPGGGATVGAVDVDGDRATAIVRLRGGRHGGARGQISLAKANGRWKVDDLSAGFLRSQLGMTLTFATLGEETTSYGELTCIRDAFDALQDATFKTIALRALAGAAADSRSKDIFTTCTGNPDQWIPFSARAPGHALGGRLTITPTVARPGNVLQPGDVLQLGVLNLGDQTITYGLAVRAGRLMDGRWRDATKAIYGTSWPAFTRQAISVAPGEHRRHRTDRIRLPASLPPGTYRILKRIGTGPNARDAHATLGETFVVR